MAVASPYASLYENDPVYQMAVKQLREAASILGLPDEVVEVLRHPEKLIQVRITFRRDNGKVETFLGWRSQHNSALGPYKGGIRYSPNVTPGEVVALSMWMTWKCALAGLPYGGGKGGIRVDPKTLSRRELEELSRRYFAALARDVDPDVDIPAPDVNTNPQIMAWYYDEYAKITGKPSYAWGVITAKPADVGGLNVRITSTGYGVALMAREAAKKLFGGLEGCTVAVHGFGNVGIHTAKYLAEWNATVVAVSDSKGYVYNPKGLNISKVMEVKEKTGAVTNYREGDVKVSSNHMELLELPVDILIPAAIENVITMENVERVKAKLIVEGANGPTTPEAEKVLHQRGTVIIPDILANSGGVTMSWIEWANNRMGNVLTDQEALERLDRIMTQNFHRVFDEWQKKYSTYPLRMAAYIIAIDRVVRAMKLRGWI